MSSTRPLDWFVGLMPMNKPEGAKYFTLSDLYTRPEPFSKDHKSVGLVEGGVIIGRKSSTLPKLATKGEFESPIISRNHAQLLVTPEGQVCLVDLDSLHGTVVATGMSQPAKLSAFSPFVLRQNNDIILGKEVQSLGKDYSPHRLRVLLRYPKVIVAMTTFRGEPNGRMSSEVAADIFATAHDVSRIRAHIAASFVAPSRPLSSDADEEISSSNAIDNDAYKGTSEVSDPSQCFEHFDDESDDADSDCDERGRTACRRTNTYRVPSSLLYTSEDDHDWPRGSSADEHDGSETDTNDDDHPPEVLSLRGRPPHEDQAALSPVPSRQPGSPQIPESRYQFAEAPNSTNNPAALAAAERFWAEVDSASSAQSMNPGEDLAVHPKKTSDGVVADNPGLGSDADANSSGDAGPAKKEQAVSSGLGVWYSYTSELEADRSPIPPRASQPGPVIFTPVKDNSIGRAASPYYSPCSPPSIPWSPLPVSAAYYDSMPQLETEDFHLANAEVAHAPSPLYGSGETSAEGLHACDIHALKNDSDHESGVLSLVPDHVPSTILPHRSDLHPIEGEPVEAVKIEGKEQGEPGLEDTHDSVADDDDDYSDDDESDPDAYGNDHMGDGSVDQSDRGSEDDEDDEDIDEDEVYHDQRPIHPRGYYSCYQYDYDDDVEDEDEESDEDDEEMDEDEELSEDGTSVADDDSADGTDEEKDEVAAMQSKTLLSDVATNVNDTDNFESPIVFGVYPPIADDAASACDRTRPPQISDLLNASTDSSSAIEGAGMPITNAESLIHELVDDSASTADALPAQLEVDEPAVPVADASTLADGAAITEQCDSVRAPHEVSMIDGVGIIAHPIQICPRPRTPSFGESDSTSCSEAESNGPITPESSRKRSLPVDFDDASADQLEHGLALSSPSAAKGDQLELRPLKKPRSIGSAIGLVVLGAALGSVGTIAGLMQMAD